MFLTKLSQVIYLEPCYSMPNVMNVVERSPEIDVDAKLFYESALRDLNEEKGFDFHHFIWLFQ